MCCCSLFGQRSVFSGRWGGGKKSCDLRLVCECSVIGTHYNVLGEVFWISVGYIELFEMLLDSMSKTVASYVRLDPDLIWHRQPHCLLQQKRNDDLVNGSLTRQLNSQRSVDSGGWVTWANYFKEHTCLNESSWHLLKCCQDSLIKCLSWCLGVRWNPGNKSRPISSSCAVVNSEQLYKCMCTLKQSSWMVLWWIANIFAQRTRLQPPSDFTARRNTATLLGSPRLRCACQVVCNLISSRNCCDR